MLSQKIPFGGNQFPSDLRDLLANPERETPKWGAGVGIPPPRARVDVTGASKIFCAKSALLLKKCTPSRICACLSGTHPGHHASPALNTVH